MNHTMEIVVWANTLLIHKHFPSRYRGAVCLIYCKIDATIISEPRQTITAVCSSITQLEHSDTGCPVLFLAQVCSGNLRTKKYQRGKVEISVAHCFLLTQAKGGCLTGDIPCCTAQSGNSLWHPQTQKLNNIPLVLVAAEQSWAGLFVFQLARNFLKINLQEKASLWSKMQPRWCYWKEGSDLPNWWCLLSEGGDTGVATMWCLVICPSSCFLDKNRKILIAEFSLPNLNAMV